jgi:hypothetical protein
MHIALSGACAPALMDQPFRMHIAFLALRLLHPLACARGPTLRCTSHPLALRLLHPLACARGPTLRVHIAFLATFRMHIALPGARPLAAPLDPLGSLSAVCPLLAARFGEVFRAHGQRRSLRLG